MRALRGNVFAGSGGGRLHGFCKCVLLAQVQAMSNIQIVQIRDHPGDCISLRSRAEAGGYLMNGPTAAVLRGVEIQIAALRYGRL